jgi:cytochrome oxidase Cu insertion factor (SCO1/SenC/PrrC family)/thiol-disulfide isomerase/thioredoxin
MIDTPHPAPDSVQPRFSWKLWAAGAGSLALILAVVFTFGATPPPAAVDVAPGISGPGATLMQLDMLTGMNVTAPSFELTDQHGKPMTLTQFRGRSVVLTVNDDRCEDLCTLLAQDVLAANRDLGPAAGNVAFVSINANPYYPGVDAVKSWSDKHGLGRAANWEFGTGSPSQLAATWRDYGVPVGLDPASKTVTHGAEIFFIDPAGREAAIGQFGTESANTGLFAHAMAQMAVDLLPEGQRARIGGPSLAAPAPGGANLGATPAPIVLPYVGVLSTASSAASPGRYQVVNFWSSTCTACIREMPDIQKEFAALGGSVAFVGVDVADQRGGALAAAKRAGSAYPLVADFDGATAGRFQISGLPYTVILSSTGKVLVRHPGVFTAAQLDYMLKSLDPALAGD